MKINVKPGKYVVAVSGGVDSVVLLDLLARQPGVELVVAHFEHGIRTDSDEDRKTVQAAAARYKLPFVFERGNLGAETSEEKARQARYSFLRKVMAGRQAQAIITAHHQDDLIETAVINLLRGTGLKGLGGVRSGGELVRPLLGVNKSELLQHAKTHNLHWREDSTNADERYLRNYIRRRIMPGMSQDMRKQLLQQISNAAVVYDSIMQELEPHISGAQIDKQWFAQLPYDVSAEAMAAWLRNNRAQFDRKSIHRLTVFAKTAAAGKRADVGAGVVLESYKNYVVLVI